MRLAVWTHNGRPIPLWWIPAPHVTCTIKKSSTFSSSVPQEDCDFRCHSPSNLECKCRYQNAGALLDGFGLESSRSISVRASYESSELEFDFRNSHSGCWRYYLSTRVTL